jgi:hypothetical protein
MGAGAGFSLLFLLLCWALGDAEGLTGLRRIGSTLPHAVIDGGPED